MNRKIILFILFTILSAGICLGQSKKKLSEDEEAKMTPDQRIAYENDRNKVKHKKSKDDNVKKKVKRAKKQDKKSRKIKQPKQKKRKAKN